MKRLIPLHSRTPLKRKTRLRQVSQKRAKENREYFSLARQYLEETAFCEARIEGVCRSNPTQIHHMARRYGKLLTERNYFLAVCGPCHTWIEHHGKQARAMGLIVEVNKL